MFVCKSKYKALQKENSDLKLELQKVKAIRNAYMAVLSEIGQTLIDHGASPNVGLVAGVAELAPKCSITWDSPATEEDEG